MNGTVVALRESVDTKWASAKGHVPLYPVIALTRVWNNRAYNEALMIHNIETLARVVLLLVKLLINTKIDVSVVASRKVMDSNTARVMGDCAISCESDFVNTR